MQTARREPAEEHYLGDGPPDLPERLLGAGFLADPPESVMVAEMAHLDMGVAPPDGVELVTVTTAGSKSRLCVRLRTRPSQARSLRG